MGLDSDLTIGIPHFIHLSAQKLIFSCMSRQVAWRNKPTALITQMIPVASEMKLYLVNEIGPTSFLFKDENENKFKVNIGLQVSCSCGIINNDHCIHTLYVMLKKYKVPETHPIIWQASYLDSELEGLIQLKYRPVSKEPKTTFMKKRKMRSMQEEDDEDFPPLEEDATCAICYEDMQGQCYSSCTVCRKALHSKCLKVWAKHKIDNGAKVTCPMCRSEFQNALSKVDYDLQRWEKRYTVHKGTHCKTCGCKNIKGLIYRCLLCPNTDLCKMCYEGNQHLDHDRFFVKELSTEPWRIAPLRIKKSKRQLFDMIKQINVRDLPQNVQSVDFVVCLFPTMREFQGSQPVNELGIVGNQMLSKQHCTKCRSPGDESMKRLNCGHYVHATCLASMFTNKQFRCEIDQEVMCPGYLSAMEIKVPAKKSKSSQVGFIKAGEETRRIAGRMAENDLSVGFKVERINQRPKQALLSSKLTTKSKDRNFRIMKKQVMDRKAELESLGVGVGFGPMLVTGLTQQAALPQSNSSHSRPPVRNRTTPKFK